jgi:hypothetical protein
MKGTPLPSFLDSGGISILISYERRRQQLDERQYGAFDSYVFLLGTACAKVERGGGQAT